MEVGASAHRPRTLSEEDIIAAVADLLADNGYQFIPDDKLSEMRRVLQPFMVTV